MAENVVYLISGDKGQNPLHWFPAVSNFPAYGEVTGKHV